jgi:CheY-like chemotaxis protein
MERKKLVLLLDSNQGDRDEFALELRRNGYLVTEVATADEAVRRAHEVGPDLIVTQYPELMEDGTPFLSVVKADPQLKHIKVLAVSREMNDSEMAESLRLGGDAYLPKPAHPVQVVMDVRRLIGPARAE